jgi:hypothetical protein
VRLTVASASAATILAACSAGLRSPISSGGNPLLYVEVADNVGLPLPDATVELFTRMDRGLFREWIAVDPATLAEGIHLLRFSYPGFRPALFSVPVRDGGRVSLRVRLVRETAPGKKHEITATRVHATGVAVHGKETTEIVGKRRVLARADLDATEGMTIAVLLREARETGLVVEDTPDGLHSVRQLDGWTPRCPVQVMINGDATLLLPFGRFEELYRFSEPEAIEVVARATTLPFYFRRSDNRCGLLMVWLTGRQL